VAQVVRQNEHAQVLPVNTIEWVDILLTHQGVSLGASAVATREALLSAMEAFVAAYNEHPEVDAYSGEPAAGKRRRKSAGGSAAPKVVDDGADKGMKVGNRRLTAIKNILRHCTMEGFAKLKMHLLWVSDFKASALNDELLGKRWFFPGSTLPAELFNHAGDAGMFSAAPAGLSTQALGPNPVLSPVPPPSETQQDASGEGVLTEPDNGLEPWCRGEGKAATKFRRARVSLSGCSRPPSLSGPHGPSPKGGLSRFRHNPLPLCNKGAPSACLHYPVQPHSVVARASDLATSSTVGCLPVAGRLGMRTFSWGGRGAGGDLDRHGF
jgi:hypothetical protein